MITYEKDEDLQKLYKKLVLISSKIVGISTTQNKIFIHTNEDLTNIEKTNIEAELGYKIKENKGL